MRLNRRRRFETLWPIARRGNHWAWTESCDSMSAMLRANLAKAHFLPRILRILLSRGSFCSLRLLHFLARLKDAARHLSLPMKSSTQSCQIPLTHPQKRAIRSRNFGRTRLAIPHLRFCLARIVYSRLSLRRSQVAGRSGFAGSIAAVLTSCTARGPA